MTNVRASWLHSIGLRGNQVPSGHISVRRQGDDSIVWLVVAVGLRTWLAGDPIAVMLYL